MLLLIALAACGTPASTPDASPWQAAVQLPAARLEPGVVALGDRLVVIDGFDGTLAIIQRVDVLDTITGTWSQLPDAPVAWTHVDAAAAGGALYLLGGLETTDFTANGSTWVLPAGATAWKQLASMPPGLERGAAAIVAAPPKIYVIGGAVANAAVATVLAYNIADDTWTQLPDLPSPRSHPAATLLSDGSLLVAGGLHTLDASQPIADVDVLPIGATAWQPRRPMPTARGGCAYALFGARFVCTGGEAGTAALDVTEAYDWAHDTWETWAPMPSKRAGTQGARIGTKLYVPGGAHVLAYLPDATMDVLTVE
jgi:N-acetylneuraminic acid mutarotase